MTNTTHNQDVLTQAMDAFLKEEYSDSIGLFSALLTEQPDHKIFLASRGSAFLRLNRLDEALADLDKALALDPNYGAAYASRAAVHQELGHDALAADDLATVAGLTQVNLETYAGQNNIWQTRQFQVEQTLESELHR